MMIRASLLINNTVRRGFPACCSSFWTVAWSCGFWHRQWWCYSSGFATALQVSNSNACKVEDSGNAWDRLGIIHWECRRTAALLWAWVPSVKASTLKLKTKKVQNKQNTSGGQFECLVPIIFTGLVGKEIQLELCTWGMLPKKVSILFIDLY